MELSEISSLPEKSARDLPRVINRMLGQVFLYRDKEDDKDDYYYVHRNRSACEGALKLAGFTLLHDDYHSIFQVVSEFSYCRSHYKLDETLMILVLRKLYEEHCERLSLAQDPVVTIGEVRDEYRTITGKERDLGITQYETLLRRLRAMGLVDTVDGRTVDVHDAEARLRLRGSVRMILPVQSVDELSAWICKYRSVGSEEESL
jgi:hypothetical protein